MNRLTEMKTEELREELGRLKAGKVGPGFEREYLRQAIEVVQKELKLREPRVQPLPHETAAGRA
jgi:predicted outer membrane protein